MRLLVNFLIVVMLAAIVAGVLFHYQQEDRKTLTLQVVHQAMTQLQEQVYYHAALTNSTASQASYPHEISPSWFPNGLPRNTLVPSRQPWIDVAAADDHGDQPPDPIIHGPNQAGFWYNPNRGIFRARVMPQSTMSDTVELYNNVNGTSLTELVERSATFSPPNKTALADTDAPGAPGVSDTDVPAEKPMVKHKAPTLRDQDP